MAAKKDFSKDAADIFGLRERKELEARQRAETPPEQPPAPVVIKPAPKAPERKESTRPRTPAKARAASQDASAMTTKTFRITERQHKALKIRSAHSDDPSEKDISAIVRKALDSYLASDLKNL